MSTALDRSTLDQKDRTELQTIAEAMGGKPGSRTRKAEIIDMILELAGFDPDADAGGDDDEAADDAETNGDDDAKDGDDKHDNTDENADGDADDKDGGSARGRSKNDGDRGDNRSDDKADGGDDKGDHKSGGQDGQGQKQQQQTDTEAGNRRRRRRGRDRNRDDGQPEWDGTTSPVDGNLDLRDEGFGFVRLEGAMPSTKDIYVPVKLVRQFGLRRGDRLVGASRPANRNEKNPALVEVTSVNGANPEAALDRPLFESLTAQHPSSQITLTRDGSVTTMALDVIAPIGKGQRALVTGPVRSGKSAALREIARSVRENASDVAVSVVLIGGRPEEAADWEDIVDGEVAVSTFDGPRDEQVAVAELAIERAKRQVETGSDACVLIDGLTALVGAYNAVSATGDAVLGNGLDVAALEVALGLFGSARNLGDEGSLTIIGTADVDTGSDLDDGISAELRRAANMELRLDGDLARARVLPAIDILGSATLRDDLLLDDAAAANGIRRDVAVASAGEGGAMSITQAFIDQLESAGSPAKFLKAVAKSGLKA